MAIFIVLSLFLVIFLFFAFAIGVRINDNFNITRDGFNLRFKKKESSRSLEENKTLDGVINMLEGMGKVKRTKPKDSTKKTRNIRKRRLDL